MIQFVLLLTIYVIIFIVLIIMYSKIGERNYWKRSFGTLQKCPFGSDSFEEMSREYTGPIKYPKGVITYSLYGNYRKYSINLKKSLLAIPTILNGWYGRVYVGVDIPDNLKDDLLDLGGEVVVMGPHKYKGHEAALWRYRAAAEMLPFASLDADDIFDEYIACKIRKWMDSGETFGSFNRHAFLLTMAAGLWGARPKPDGTPPIPDIVELVEQHCEHWFGYDEAFLRIYINPMLSEHGYYEARTWYLRELTVFAIFLLVIAMIISLVWAYQSQNNCKTIKVYSKKY